MATNRNNVSIRAIRPGYRISFDEILNAGLVALLAFGGLPLLHRKNTRWLWHIKDIPPHLQPEWEGELRPPVPRVRRTFRQKLGYAILYLLTATALVSIFGPLSNQQMLHAFLSSLSADSASYTRLVVLVAHLLLILLLALVAAATYAARQKTNSYTSGDPDEMLRLHLHETWLFAFAGSVMMITLLCYVTGNAINLTLR